jgi:phytoene synthase
VTAAADPVTQAYRECERITREQARNFAWGIRLLPRPKRTALSAVYAMARRIDDIGDGALPTDEKLRLLGIERAALEDPGAHHGDPVLRALDDAARRLPIPLTAFGELIDGCGMDIAGRSYETIEDLVDYCRCVAGSVGRLSLGVFDPRLDRAAWDTASAQADALGIALQLTNILRDIREDLGIGRVYLPARDLELFGCELSFLPDGSLDPCDGALAEVIRFEAARAWGWYDRGLRLVGVLDRRSAACCAAMAGIYRDLLGRIAADPSLIMGGRHSLPARRKLWIAGRSIVSPGSTGG